MKFKESYSSPRALAIEAGLAKPSRGRLSSEAKALIDEARSAGVMFESEVYSGSTFNPEDGPPAPVEREEVPDELRDGFNYARLPSPGWIKEPLTFQGRDSDGHLVQWYTCHKCSMFSAHCTCETVHPPVPVTDITSVPFDNDTEGE